LTPPAAPISPNPLLDAVEAPPVALVQSWTAGRNFPAERPLLDLAQAAPGWPMAPELVAHTAETVADPARAGYAPILGRADLRAALAAEIGALYRGRISAENIAITSGCNQAFVVAVLALARAGDAVLLPTPWYFNHKMTLDMFGIEATPLPCRVENAMVPDPDAARRLITPRTRAIVLVTPNNPTGAVYPAETLTAFRDLAAAEGLALIVDETYRDFLPGPAAPHGLFQDSAWSENLVHLYSFSKAFAMPGLRVGAAVAGEPIVQAMQKALDSIAICATQAGQAAALFGLERLGDWRAGKRAEMAARLDAFRAAMAPLADRFPIVSAGAFFAYCRHPFETDGLAAAKRLADEAAIMAMPGSAFGPGQDGMIRFAFGNIAPERAAEVGARLAALD